jgi:hypothetical protein
MARDTYKNAQYILHEGCLEIPCVCTVVLAQSRCTSLIFRRRGFSGPQGRMLGLDTNFLYVSQVVKASK